MDLHDVTRSQPLHTHLLHEAHNLNLGLAVLQDAEALLLVEQVKHLAAVNLKEAYVDRELFRAVGEGQEVSWCIGECVGWTPSGASSHLCSGSWFMAKTSRAARA